MKPDAVDDSVFMPERTLGNRKEVMSDELVNGEYGLVINGHSLVRDKTVLHYQLSAVTKSDDIIQLIWHA